MPNNGSDVEENWDCQFTPSGEVTIVPLLPTATNKFPPFVIARRELLVEEDFTFQKEGTVNLLVEFAVPSAVVTLIGPELALLGTVVLIDEPFSTVKWAEVPLKLTAVAPVNPLPETATAVPGAPEVGEKLVIAGAADPPLLPPPLLLPAPQAVRTDKTMMRTAKYAGE
jgi:hypothetical protein